MSRSTLIKRTPGSSAPLKFSGERGRPQPLATGSKSYSPIGASGTAEGGFHLPDGGTVSELIVPKAPTGQDVLPTLTTAASYAQAVLGTTSADALKEREKTITSLAPEEPGLFRDLMLEGEEAFRNQQYRKANEKFDMANDLSLNNPETLLSLMHVSFATSVDRYSLTALYFSEALTLFPELPLAQVHPKNFYALKSAGYVQDLMRLENHVQKEPKDIEAQLILAYMFWRDGKIEPAREALQIVLTHAPRKGGLPSGRLVEAAEILWDGIVASGTVPVNISGPLEPNPLPEKPTEGGLEKQAENPETATPTTRQ